jgi:hypothetical protein
MQFRVNLTPVVFRLWELAVSFLGLPLLEIHRATERARAPRDSLPFGFWSRLICHPWCPDETAET